MITSAVRRAIFDRYLALKPEDILDVGARELGDDVAMVRARFTIPRP